MLLVAILAILPGDLGFGADFLGIVFAVFAVGVVITLIFLYRSTRHPDEHKRYAWPKREWLYAIIVLILVLVFATSTLGLLPYPYAHPRIKASMVVNVQAVQFQWCVAPAPNWGTQCQAEMIIPLGSTVLFNVTSIDVTHGFGLYSSDGHLLDQVQVMPGYHNNIVYQFTTLGIYYIRCLEFCGWGHFGMVSQMNVT